MNSLQNFDRSLDKFHAWLSEAESSMEGVELEADRLGGRRDPSSVRLPLQQLKVGPRLYYNGAKIHCTFRRCQKILLSPH